jgi:two-component SAPR family response regulator
MVRKAGSEREIRSTGHEDRDAGHRVGHHGCGFYSNTREQWSLVVPFVQVGLRQRQRCLYVAEENSVQEVQAGLQEHGIPVRSWLDRGQLHVVMARDTCLAPDPFSLDVLLEKLESAVQQAESDGYRGLHIAIEMSWVLQQRSSLARLAEYEARINTSFSSSRLALLCQYNRQRFPAEILLDVLRTHPEVRTDQTIHVNPYYLPPHIFLTQNRREQFYWYLGNLSSGTWQAGKGSESRAPRLAGHYPQVLTSASRRASGPVWSPWETKYEADKAIAGPKVSPVERLGSSDSPWRWQVYCLGELKVHRHDGTQVSWDVARGATVKTKTLFAFLLEQGQAGAARERLVDLLWPDQDDLDKGLARLYHTVHCLRRALEPDLVGREKASRYVLREGDRYYLALPEDSWIDAVTFEQFCYQGEYLTRIGQDEDALACYQAAERLYTGDFLGDIPLEYTERLDDDWCWSRRYWLEEMYIKLHLCLAELYLKRGASREALAYYRKALTADPAREEAHQGLMRVFRQAGRRDALVRQHRLWQELLHRLDDGPIDAETMHLYEELVQEFTSGRQNME